MATPAFFNSVPPEIQIPFSAFQEHQKATENVQNMFPKMNPQVIPLISL